MTSSLRKLCDELAEGGNPLASCPWCRSLVVCGDAAPFDPTPPIAVFILTEARRDGMDLLAPQTFGVGEIGPDWRRVQVRRHHCPNWRPR